MFPTKGNFWLNTDPMITRSAQRRISETEWGLWGPGQAQGPAVGKGQDREYALLRYLGTSQPRRPGGLMRDLESVFRVCEL